MKYDSDNQRVHRINSVLMKEIAQIIQSEINDPRIKNVVTVSYTHLTLPTTPYV